MPSTYKLLQIALAVFGALCLLLYPLAVVWPSGWAWHSGTPHQSDYFMMIVGLYATLGIFLLNAARTPQANLSLIWFTVWSSVVTRRNHGGAVLRRRTPDGTSVGRCPGAAFGGRRPVGARVVVRPQTVCA
jgi:hypothetical protein